MQRGAEGEGKEVFDRASKPGGAGGESCSVPGGETPQWAAGSARLGWEQEGFLSIGR